MGRWRIINGRYAAVIPAASYCHIPRRRESSFAHDADWGALSCVGAVREPPLHGLLFLCYCFLAHYFYIKGLSALEH